VVVLTPTPVFGLLSHELLTPAGWVENLCDTTTSFFCGFIGKPDVWNLMHLASDRNPAAQANCIAKDDVLLQLPAFV